MKSETLENTQVLLQYTYTCSQDVKARSHLGIRKKVPFLSVVLQYTLPTQQNNPFFLPNLDSVVLLARSCILAFKQLMGQWLPFLQQNVNIYFCSDNTYVLSPYLVFGCICVLQPLQRTAISQLDTAIIHMNGITVLIKLLSLGITAVGPHRNLLAFS